MPPFRSGQAHARPLTQGVRAAATSLALAAVALAVGAGPAAAATFTVTNTNDTGAGTLRQAILVANAATGVDTIAFSISPGTAPFTISPTSALPMLGADLTIDATTQVGFDPLTPRPVVELNGTLAGSTTEGLIVGGSNTTIRGLAINRFGRSGIEVLGSGASIKGNYLGTDPTGTIDRGNGRDGVALNGATNAVIGGTSAADRNLLSETASTGYSSAPLVTRSRATT